MNCHVCGSGMTHLTTDMPFKISDTATVIIRQVPTLQCDNCREYLLDDKVMAAVDRILAARDSHAEIEVVPYAA